MVEVLRHEDFAPHVDRLFRFEGWHGTLRLVRIDRPDMPNWPEHIRLPFTLIFQGPRGDVMPEASRVAIVDEATRFEFHIMPIHTPSGDRQDYQAVFS